MFNSFYINLNNIENQYYNSFFDNLFNNNNSYVKKIEGLINLNNKNKLCLIEKIIHELCEFYSQETINEHFFAEFWIKNIKNTTPNFHLDCDENAKNKYENLPVLSIVLYLNDCIIPTIITNKTINNNSCNELIVSFPKKMKSICFDGGKYYHGIIAHDNIETIKRNILIINLWKNHKPKNIKEFVIPNEFFETVEEKYYNHFDKILQFTDSLAMQNVSIDNNLFEINLHNSSFLKNKKEILNIINKLYNKMNCDNFLLINQDKQQNKNNIIQLKHFFHKNTCEWFVIESEKYAINNNWHTDRHSKYPTTDIPILNIKYISDFSNFIINKIQKIIKKKYNIPKTTSFYIHDAFIVKYETGQQDELSIHADSSDYTINIALSDLKNYDGGGTFFEKINQTILCDIGDMIIHPGYLKHAGIKITRGKRYLFVIFLKIQK